MTLLHQMIEVTVLSYMVAAAVVLAAVAPLTMAGERFAPFRVARWTGWLAVAVVLAAFAVAAR